MIDKIPVDTLYHITVVTRDARQTALEHARFYGIPTWKVVEHRPEALLRTSVHGRGRSHADVNAGFAGTVAAPGEFGFLSVKGTSPNRGVTFEIIQPTGGLSTFEHFLVTRGQGIHSMCLTVVTPDEIGPLREFLAVNNVSLALSYALNDAADFLYFDTRKLLGGFYTQVIVAHRPDWESTLAASEVWDFSTQIPHHAGAKPLHRTTGIPHFGVVVHDVEAHMKHFVKLFGTTLWRAMDWRTSDWLLEDTTYNGQPVWHSFYAVRGDVGRTPLDVSIGFELVQPLQGPSHYKENFLQLVGPGIHHLDLAFPFVDWNEWTAFNAWCRDEAASPCCMSGWLRGRSHLYQYHDTTKTLGYVTEVHAPPPANAPMKRTPPHYWYDFAVRGDY